MPHCCVTLVMQKIVNFFLKSLSFDVFQLIIFNCEISMRILFYEFCNKNFCNFELKVFENNKEVFNYWLGIINMENNKLLKYSKLSNIHKKLSSDEVLEIVGLIGSVDFHETFEYLLDFVELNEEVALILINKVLSYFERPNTKKQQQIQLETIKKLMKYQSVNICSNC